MLGVSAQQLAAEESKTEHEKFYKLLQTEAKNAKDQLLNLEIAIPLNVQVCNCINISLILMMTFHNQLKLKRNHEYMFFISLVDCKWSPWGPWDVCTRTCGGGMQARSRTIVEQERHGGKPCVGDPQEMQGCNMQACPSNYITLNNLLKTIN